MSNTPHDLHSEFLEFAERMTELKVTNTHFRRLAEQYHEVNDLIHRAETNIEPMDDLEVEKLRKQRLHIKDQIHVMLTG